jgi:polyphenol oxidase
MILPDLSLGEWHAADGCVWWEASLGPARLVMSTRLGGGSAPPYDALNLGLHVGDSPAIVIENRRRFWAAAGSPHAEGITTQSSGETAVPLECAGAPEGGRLTPLSVRRLDAVATRQVEQSPGLPLASTTPRSTPLPVVAEQVHGARIAVVGAAEAGRGWRDRVNALPETDALITRDTRIAPAILVADCAPVALVLPEGVLGMAHAGWRGLADGVLEATLRAMAAQGSGPPEQCQAVIGPCIRGCCYEVGEEVWRRFPESCLTPSDRPGARRLDLMAAVVHRLRDAGLPADQIHPLGLCTACQPYLFFSHRRATREGPPTTGRMALIGWLE